MNHTNPLVALIIDATVAEPAPLVRVPLTDAPIIFASMAVVFALLGGFIVQVRSMVYGKTTRAQACSELLYCAASGLVAYYIAAKQDYTDIDLYFTALIAGLAGRPLLLAVQKIATNSLLQALGGAKNDDKNESPPS